MKLLIGAVATALVLATGSGFNIQVAAEELEVAAVEDSVALASCPPDTDAISRECADQVCASVSDSATLDIVEQALVGRAAADLVRDFGATDPANSALIEACVATGPSGVFAAYNGSEVAKVGESIPASEQ